MVTPPVAEPARRLPRVVWALSALMVLVGFWWSVLTPITEAPDEQHHFGLVLYLADGNGYPDFDQLPVLAATQRICREYSASTRACPRPEEYQQADLGPVRRHPAAEAPSKASRPGWRDPGAQDRWESRNQMAQHPPLYYEAMAQILRVERAVSGNNLSLDRELALLRLVNALLLAPIPLLAWWTAARFGLARRIAVTAALLTLGLPLLTHVGSSLNNDNLLVVLAGVLTGLLAGVVRGDRSRRTAVIVGVVVALGLLTKAFAAVFPPLVVVAYAVGWWSDRGGRRWQTSVAPAATALVVAAAGAAWWFVRVRTRTGQFAPTIESSNYTSAAAPPGFEPDLLGYLGSFFPLLNRRFWGSFGWHTAALPSWCTTVLTLVVLALVASALRPAADGAGNDRWRRLFLLVPLGAVGASVLLRAWNLYSLTGAKPFIQGRYLLSGIFGLLALAAAGLARHTRRATVPVAAGAAITLQVLGVHTTLRTWWGDGLPVRDIVAWNPWPGELLGAAAVAALVVAGWAAWELVAEVAADRGDVDQPEDRYPRTAHLPTEGPA